MDSLRTAFIAKCQSFGLTTAVVYEEYSDAVQACSLKDIDMDSEEYGMVEAILSSSEIEVCHSEKRYLKVFQNRRPT